MRAWVFALGLIASVPLPARAVDDPTTLVRRAIDAAGGTEKLGAGKLQVARSEGAVFAGGVGTPFRGQSWREGFVRSRTETTTGEARESKLFADGFALRVEADGRLNHLTGEAAESGLTEVYVSGVTDLVPLLTDRWFVLSLTGTGMAFGRPADGVRVCRPHRPDVFLWFDRETGLLAQFSARYPRGTQDVILDDYRDFGGAKRPTRRIGFLNGQKVLEERTTDYTLADVAAPTLFPVARPDPPNDPREVVRRYVVAVGGADRLVKQSVHYVRFQTRVDKSTLPGAVDPVVEVETERWAEYPVAQRSKLTQTANGRKSLDVEVYHRGGGWAKSDDAPVRPLSAEDLRDAWRGIELGCEKLPHLLLDDPAVGLTGLGSQPIGDRTAIGVAVTRLGRSEAALWFDTESHLLVLRTAMLPGGSRRDTWFSSYTERDGIKLPTREIILIDGKKAAEVLTVEHRHTERLDPALLTRPNE